MNDLIQINVKYFVFILSYFVGSLPTAYLIGKLQNIDIRKVGSGNVGATNTARVLGKKWAIVVLAIDILKGSLAIGIARFLINDVDPYGIEILMAGLFSVAGHIFPVWLSFKGGKGVATVCGVVIALSPFQALIAFLVFVTTVYLTKFVSLSSLMGAMSLPLSFFFFFNYENNFLLLYFFIALAFIISIMHLKNIKRLLSGTESKISSFAR
ncbi:MAG: glycerol-3-phosphate 1-O-acyltransferase PlsY [Spirochaetia bacterium]|nr:glycerol-3-phosphate 1-O-acyltransferase PlsY [Spirochaetia bacterium]